MGGEIMMCFDPISYDKAEKARKHSKNVQEQLNQAIAKNSITAEQTNFIEIDASPNLFDKTKALVSKFYSRTAGDYKLVERDNASLSCYLLPVDNGKKYTVTGTGHESHLVGEDMTSLVAIPSSKEQPITFDLTNRPNVKYIAFSWNHTKLETDSYMAVEGETLPSQYIPYYYKKTLAEDIIIPQKVEKYYVGANKEFTSLTDCLRSLEGNENEKVIYIDAGTYDIFEEIGGTAFVDSIPAGATWRDVSVIVPNNTSIIGVGEVTLEFKPTAEQITPEAANLLSPINVFGNVVMKNIFIDCDNCRYAIHDDGSCDSANDGTTHIYENVRINKVRTDYGSGAAIGCGFGAKQVWHFKNCDVWSGLTPLSLHNNNRDFDNSIIKIEGCALRSKSGNLSLRFGNANPNQVRTQVTVVGTYLTGSIEIDNEGAAERPNAFDVTVIGSSDVQVNVVPSTNIYTPKVYAI